MAHKGTIDTRLVTDLYATQSVAIDEGDVAAWAATYSHDGSFFSPTYGEVVVGSAALIEFGERVYAQIAAEGIQQRHWVSNVVVDAEAGTARAYMMIIRTGLDGEATLLRHITVEDELIFDEAGSLKVQSRRVRWDAKQ